MWTRYSVVALVSALLEGWVVAGVIWQSAMRRAFGSARQRGNGTSRRASAPRSVPEPVGVAMTGTAHGSGPSLPAGPEVGSPEPSGSVPPVEATPRIVVADLLVGLLVLGLLWFISVIALIVVARLGVFGMFDMGWFCAVAGLPLAAVVVMLRARRGRPSKGSPARAMQVSTPARALLLVAALLVPVAVYASVIEPDRLDEDVHLGVQMGPGRAGASPLRVGVISDIQTRHVGPHEVAAVDRLMSLQPDVILVAGDVFQSPPDFVAELPALRDLLRRLQAPGGTYLVQGDTDPPETLELMVAGTQVRLLRDEIVRTGVRDREVTIGGLDIDVSTPQATRTIEELQNTPGSGDVRLLLSHRPDSVLRLAPGTRVDLVAAGHTHGGQIAVPGFGPLLTLSAVPRSVGAGGLHDLDGRRIFVSKGVGLERGQAPQVRFGVVPTVGLVELA